MIPTRESPAPAETLPTPKRCDVFHAWVSAEVAITIEREAKRRSMHPDALLAEMTTLLAMKRSFRAILDSLFTEKN